MVKWLKEIHLRNFRNFERLSVKFVPRINLIVGENGCGKTNLLEAVHMLSTGRSFRTNELKEAIKQGEESFTIDALYEDHGIEQHLVLSFDGKTRALKHNETHYKSFSPLLGLLPSVVYAPSDIDLIIGTPKERRHFMNVELSQSDPLYVYYLTRYTKALVQRNALVKRKQATAIEVWEEELIKSGNYLIHKRNSFLQDLTERANREYRLLAKQQEELSIDYQACVTQENFTCDHFRKVREREFYLGHTLIGPHRDDLEIRLKGESAKKFASEGQKRTLISAIKLASLSRFENPLFSIDDFAAHLDNEREQLLKNQIVQKDQIFITTPSPIALDIPGINLLQIDSIYADRN